jgi:glycosyltransferase involved in cell wall biosynthesis
LIAKVRFSVITPSFNQGRFIRRTVESVLSQGKEVSEYAVMDGGSSDETLDVLRSYGTRIQWISERDRGQAHAVNKGLNATSGDAIGWLNSDDIYYPDALRRVGEFLDSNPEVDVVYGMANHIDIHDAVIEPYPTEPWDLERLKGRCFLCQPAVFFRRRVVERCGALDESLKYCMDYEYWLRLAMRGVCFAYLPEVLSGSRLYAETKTLGDRVNVHAEINRMLRRTLGHTPARWLFNYGHVVADDWHVSRNSRLMYLAVISVVSLYAAMRWNGHPGADMVRLLQRDWRHALKTIWRR